MNTLKIFNPATDELIVDIPADDASSVITKTANARAAQPRWAATSLAERKACMIRFRALLAERIEQLASTLTSEMGKPIKQSRNEINGLLGRIDFFLAEVESVIGTETVMSDGGMTERISHDALGVIANISAWNYPYFVGGNVFVPALLTGNTVLYKPSEFASLTGWHITRLLHEAGIPQDVFIPLIGTGEVGAALLGEKLDGVFFTGSYATGAKISSAVGPRMIRLQLELGGKDPTYVADDADVNTAAESLADGAMYNTGQSCCSVERIYVHERIHDAFVDAFVTTVKGFIRGDPMDEMTYIGALTRASQLDVLESQVADAMAKGALLLAGGKRIQQAGNWFEPTVMTNGNHSM
ncbi:MAG: aldehyde dehydrogenase family protein, partial [Pseudomonadota bacterium]